MFLLNKIFYHTTTNDVAQLYDTILSIPGMNETVKIDLRISRRNVLLLNSFIEQGLVVKTADENRANFLNAVPKVLSQELSQFSCESLKKAGLTELSEKLNGLT